MVTSLSDFFRTTLSKGKDFITISEEKSHIESYLKIQKFRYNDILDYEIEIDDEIKDYVLLKLTLQPIVENALYHGIKNKRGRGKIEIRGFIDNDNIVLSVKDNGIGMREDELIHLRNQIKGQVFDDKDKGFGIANVNERIRLNYGLDYGIVIDSEYTKGTNVKISLPIIKQT